MSDSSLLALGLIGVLWRAIPLILLFCPRILHVHGFGCNGFSSDTCLKALSISGM